MLAVARDLCALTVRVILCAGVSFVPRRVYSNYVTHVLSLVLGFAPACGEAIFLCAAPSIYVRLARACSHVLSLRSLHSRLGRVLKVHVP